LVDFLKKSKKCFLGSPSSAGKPIPLQKNLKIFLSQLREVLRFIPYLEILLTSSDNKYIKLLSATRQMIFAVSFSIMFHFPPSKNRGKWEKHEKLRVFGQFGLK
jgi:hypothetical protein